MEEKKLFKVVITAIVVKPRTTSLDANGTGQGRAARVPVALGRYLVLKRSPNEKKFPSRWTVPGGKLTTEDYIHLPKDTPDYWYNVLERTLRREVKEEAGIEITNIRYVTSLADAREGDDPSLVISCLAEWSSGDVRLDQSMVEYRWVTLEEARSIDLIEGIFEEIQIADQVLKGGSAREWSREY